MTTNDQARLDEAVAKILGLVGTFDESDGRTLWLKPVEKDGIVHHTLPSFPHVAHPSQDWNALMAARRNLELKGWIFNLNGTTMQWSVYHQADDGCCDIPIAHSFRHCPETEALALCIAAVMEKEDG